MNYSIFEGLKASDLKKIEENFQTLDFGKKELIYTKSEGKNFFDFKNQRKGIYFIDSGFVKISVKSSNRNYTIAFLRERDFFGEMSVILDFEPTADVYALTDTKIYFLEAEKFNEFLFEIPQLSVNMNKYLANRAQALSANIFDHVFRPLESRVASNILNILNEFPEDFSNGKKAIGIKVTHQDLSDFIGTNRETVTKILNQFKKKGILDFVDRKIVITDLAQLEEVASVA